MAAVEKRRLVLLVPVYTDVCSTSRSTPVELQRTADDWLKLVFSTHEGPVEKEAACVNSHEGCRCDYVRLLRSLMVLTERQIVKVKGAYAITIIDNNPVATLELKVRVCHAASNIGESLGDFELVLSHLQSDALAIARRSEKSRIEAQKSEFLDATCSSCHVVGCRLHLWQADATLGPKKKLHLPDVFQSLMAHMEAEQSEIRDDVVFRPDSTNANVAITDLPRNALHLVICLMEAQELAAVSGVCSLFRHLAYEVVPGLNLVLYEHQRKGLKWMLYRETPSLTSCVTSHPYLFPRRPGRKSSVAIDLLDMKVVQEVDTTTRDLCGGLFCDEPGLGKTITVLALILRTKGQATKNARLRAEMAQEDTIDTGIRSLRSRARTVPAEDLVGSGASLIVVPDPLVEHWKYQIEAHVDSGALRTFIDETNEDLPSNSELAAYDVVVTSFSRLAREWKLHRPASALEKRMPERYGFEGPKRYSDGTIRGEVSSLLTVRWVRVIVDEGHKLGGQTPTNLMLMARILSAERRWVMTGTPTPNTLQSADLRFMHGLLVFLRNKPYGQPDARAWNKAIAKPFEQNEPIGFYRLQSVLSRILMRHTKESIREILPEPVRHTVYIDPTPSEYAQYNVVAAAVRANLVITNMDPDVPGKLHPDSLLNPINRKEALRVVANLRFACCGGVNSEVVLPDKARLETINMLSDLGVHGDNIGTVMEYLRKVIQPGMMTKCGSCKRRLQLLMVLPCGHLCCADCLEDRVNRIGPSCFLCNEVFDPEVFQELQPGFEFREVDDANDKKSSGRGRNQQQGGRGHQRPASSGRAQNNGRPRQLTETQRSAGAVPSPNRHYWTVDASKIFYAATRVGELRKELARRSALHGVGDHRRTRYVKVIIFSQFTEMIWRTKLAFEQQKIPTANFITRVAPKTRMRALKRFREDPSLNVLLLSEMGSHGLDLSFVTHVFLMEEIWDKSLEQQVVSRAHRMGAEQAVVVEQLWMRGSVESEMAKVNELNEGDYAAPPRVVHDLGPPVRTLKRKRSSGAALLNVAGKKKRKRNRSGEATKVPTGNKSSFLQRKLDYVLNHLRLLDENIAAAPREVRFSVVDENDGTTIRQAIHTIPSPDTPARTSSMMPSQPANRTTATQPVRSTRPAQNGGASARTPLRDIRVATAIQNGDKSSQHHQHGSAMRSTARPVADQNKAGNAADTRRTTTGLQPAQSPFTTVATVQKGKPATATKPVNSSSADIPRRSTVGTTQRVKPGVVIQAKTPPSVRGASSNAEPRRSAIGTVQSVKADAAIQETKPKSVRGTSSSADPRRSAIDTVQSVKAEAAIQEAKPQSARGASSSADSRRSAVTVKSVKAETVIQETKPQSVRGASSSADPRRSAIGTMQSVKAEAAIQETKPQSVRGTCSSADTALHSAAAASSSSVHVKRRSKPQRRVPQDIIVIDDEPETVKPRPPAAISTTKQTNSSPEVIVIDGSSSSEPEESPANVSESESESDSNNDNDNDNDNDSDSDSDSDSDISMASRSSSCSADNEDHFGSGDSDSDSAESDEEDKVLFSQLIHVAQRHFARHREASDKRAAATLSAPPPVEVPTSAPVFDDEETETE